MGDFRCAVEGIQYGVSVCTRKKASRTYTNTYIHRTHTHKHTYTGHTHITPNPPRTLTTFTQKHIYPHYDKKTKKQKNTHTLNHTHTYPSLLRQKYRKADFLPTSPQCRPLTHAWKISLTCFLPQFRWPNTPLKRGRPENHKLGQPGTKTDYFICYYLSFYYCWRSEVIALIRSFISDLIYFFK